MSYEIIQLAAYPGLIPTGNEIMELSNNGNGSYQMPMGVLSAARQPTTILAGGTYAVGANNYGDILVSVAAATTFNLPAASTRTGVPVSIVDIGGNAGSNNITINPNGAELIIGLSQVVIRTNYGGMTLWPISSGGWYQK